MSKFIELTAKPPKIRDANYIPKKTYPDMERVVELCPQEGGGTGLFFDFYNPNGSQESAVVAETVAEILTLLKANDATE